MLTPTDFNAIRTAGFDHVRIPIDPKCFGVGSDGAYIAGNPLKRAARPEQPNPLASHAMVELKDTIHEAINAGLAVIVDLHPVVVSEAHFHSMRIDSSMELESVYLHQLTTTEDHPLDANHPLAKFWTTFLPNFLTIEFPANKLYFEILNEPMIGFAPSRYNPNNRTVPQWHAWFKGLLQNWRNVQLNAVRHALSVNSQYSYIASTPMATLKEFGQNEYKNWGNGNWPADMPTFGNAYSPTELALPGIPGHQLVDNIIYTSHQYSPFNYTHWMTRGQQPGNGEVYRFNEDFAGVGPPNPNWDPFRPAILDAALWMGRNQFVQTEGNIPVIYYQAPIMITEAGVQHRHAGTCGEPGMCIPPIENFGPTIYSNSPLHDRFWWHWDLRKNCADFGMGWTVYEYWGGMGIGRNQLYSESDFDQPGLRLGVFDWLGRALFDQTIVTRRSN